MRSVVMCKMRCSNIFLVIAAFFCFISVQGLKVRNAARVQVNTSEIDDDWDDSNSTAFNTTQEESDYSYEDINANLTDVSTRLLTGTTLTQGQYPYVVYIVATGAKTCTGVLISVDFVLTSASCVNGATAISVQAGTASLAETAPAPVVRTGYPIVHPFYYSNTLQNDIALVKLSLPYTINGYISPITLAKKGNVDHSKDLYGKSLNILGYGLEASGGTSVLRLTTMMVMTRSRCEKAMKSLYIVPAASQDCLSTDSGTVGMCSDPDLGGPLTYQFSGDSSPTLVGIMSYYQACGTSVPNLFTRIGPHLDLIRTYVPEIINSG